MEIPSIPLKKRLHHGNEEDTVGTSDADVRLAFLPAKKRWRQFSVTEEEPEKRKVSLGDYLKRKHEPLSRDSMDNDYPKIINNNDEDEYPKIISQKEDQYVESMCNSDNAYVNTSVGNPMQTNGLGLVSETEDVFVTPLEMQKSDVISSCEAVAVDITRLEQRRQELKSALRVMEKRKRHAQREAIESNEDRSHHNAHHNGHIDKKTHKKHKTRVPKENIKQVKEFERFMAKQERNMLKRQKEKTLAKAKNKLLIRKDKLASKQQDIHLPPTFEPKKQVLPAVINPSSIIVDHLKLLNDQLNNQLQCLKNSADCLKSKNS